MKRIKRHKVKKEPLDSSSFKKEEHDLAYYIHDRVELMHQVFSALKYKELKSMAPECVRHISIDDLQELCTEELLGISSKRLCAILDGAEPPTDTESSSPSPSPQLETISLDSISSDDEVLSLSSKGSRKNKKHKSKHSRERCRRREKRKSRESQPRGEEDGEKSKASRAGLTVLELLELQARARAIRAQLQKEQCLKPTSESAPPENGNSSDNEVEIKEEPAEVVEISSEEEKPNVEKLQRDMAEQAKAHQSDSQTITKHVKDLVITIPQSKQTRKIVLNRSRAPKSTDSRVTKVTGNVASNEKESEKNKPNVIADADISKAVKEPVEKGLEGSTAKSKCGVNKDASIDTTSASNKLKKSKTKKKKKESKLSIEEDHDEITLQLSDTEKMDLLEDLDRKNLDNVSSSSSRDSESSSSTSDSDSSEGESVDKRKSSKKGVNKNVNSKSKTQSVKVVTNIPEDTSQSMNLDVSVESGGTNDKKSEESETSVDTNKDAVDKKCNDEAKADCREESYTEEVEKSEIDTDKSTEEQNCENSIDAHSVRNEDIEATAEDVTLVRESKVIDKITKASNIGTNRTEVDSTEDVKESNSNTEDEELCVNSEETAKDNSVDATKDAANEDAGQKIEEAKSNVDKQLSEGELTDNEESEIEVTVLKPEVVCISDEEVSKKKKKKKDKKKKKSKKKSDFREGSNENFFKDNDNHRKNLDNSTDLIDVEKNEDINKDEESKDCNYIIIEDEILVLSDDSSCYEVDTYLSKEPTAEEIEALSLKIDEINREEIITEEEIKKHEREISERGSSKLTVDKENSDKDNVDKESNETEELKLVEDIRETLSMEGDKRDMEGMSWKERYLGSKKVKNVLSVANIFNALRKKNIELKKKLHINREELNKALESEKETLESEKEGTGDTPVDLGSVDYYKTLEGSTKYVDPVRDVGQKESEEVDQKEKGVTLEMKRDAKQLLKMYKKLLKYNDMNRVKDPNKRKKKRSKE